MEYKKLLEKRPVQAVLVAGAGFLALAGCGSKSAEIQADRPATVVAHEFHPASTMPMMVGKVMVLMPIPEAYHLQVQQCDRAGEESADANGCISRHMTVDKATYESFPNGSQITFDSK